MMRYLIIFYLTFILYLGCSATPQPKLQFPQGTRIGVINQLENFATHQNFSSLRIGNFEKKIDVDWRLPAYFEDKLKGFLESDPRYTVVSIPAADASDTPFKSWESVGDIPRTEKIETEAKIFLKTLGAEHHLDVIILIKSFRGPSAFEIDKHPFLLEGYGLFTKKFLMSKKAYAYANIAAIVFRTDPVKYIGSGRPKNMASSLGDFDLSGDLKNLPHYEIAKLELIMKKYADQAIENALYDANLITNSSRPEQ